MILYREETKRGEIALRQNDDMDHTFEIISNGVFLMSSESSESENALARLSLSKLGENQTELHVLVGGLGMGFTLHAVLDDPRVSKVDVIEIEPSIVRWNQTFFVDLNHKALSEPRVRTFVDDVVSFVENCDPDTYHAILLDVDNGPDWLVFEDNAALYKEETLVKISKCLVPGGWAAIWSAQKCQHFHELLKRCFVHTEVTSVRNQVSGKTIEHYIYLAQSAGSKC